jgi:hypothetical protein
MKVVECAVKRAFLARCARRRHLQPLRCLISLAGPDALHRHLLLACLALISAAATSCGLDRDRGLDDAEANASASTAPILLFNAGASPNYIAALEATPENKHLSYSPATSAQLNRMHQAQVRRYRLLIVPG